MIAPKTVTDTPMSTSLNMDFNLKVMVDTNQLDWVASPSPNVWRKPLAREHAEKGHTTSIVRFEPNSYFPQHEHPLGEEILVLDGIFSDEHGDYGPGTYIRNPPGSRHTPFSRDGCKLFVKLDQFDSKDLETKRVNTLAMEWVPGQGRLEVMPLHDFNGEHVALVKWPTRERFQPHTHFGGEEILVLTGEFKDEFGSYPAGSWLRSPHMSRHHPFVEVETIIWVKVGHLPI
ncbi:MAG: cupin domain-containing protein [Gammaproteobacteria bacterium]|nr:cupin domain-containing protein [Gammaproteobacteria bacterium]